MSNNQPQPLLTSSSIFMSVALKVAILVALVQAPLLFLDWIPVEALLFTGWAIIAGYTLARIWVMSRDTLVVNDVTTLRFIASLLAAGIGVVVLYVTTMASENPAAANPTWQIKAAFISNPFAGLAVAALLTAGAFIYYVIRDLVEGLRGN